MCVACGLEGGAQVPIFKYQVQYVSHTNFTFYMCSKCAKYVGSFGLDFPKAKEFALLSAEEKQRAVIAKRCVRVTPPFFYLGKTEFRFINDKYGMLFWRLNGGEMSQQFDKVPEIK